jgi:hypothetical protein
VAAPRKELAAAVGEVYGGESERFADYTTSVDVSESERGVTTFIAGHLCFYQVADLAT